MSCSTEYSLSISSESGKINFDIKLLIEVVEKHSPEALCIPRKGKNSERVIVDVVTIKKTDNFHSFLNDFSLFLNSIDNEDVTGMVVAIALFIPPESMMDGLFFEKKILDSFSRLGIDLDISVYPQSV